MQLIGIDVGGTFTDFVWLRGGKLHVHKVATTPGDQSDGVVAGLESLGAESNAAVVHGTTVATNALLERRGARTALLTTEGFADVLSIGRQNRPHLYRLSQQRPASLVPSSRRFEIPERLDATGNVFVPLDEDALRAVIACLREESVESLAVVFLFSFRNPHHEQRVAALVREHLPDVHVSVSSDVLPEYREYERTAATVVNAYVQPLVGRYLGRLDAALGERTLRVMQSNGGTISPAGATRHAARLVLSGPAGGVVGAFSLARRAMAPDAPHVLTLDMGGTSTDVALCPGVVPTTTENEIAGLPLRLPSTEIHTVGAGGGSMARVDVAGVLHVGPESAGADPGPVCYGRGGTVPTVTDANLVLGRLSAAHFLGGSEKLDADAARHALGRLGRRLGLSPEQAALGVLRVANATMERALRRVSVERGHDPRNYVLVPFGGAGPLHACDLATALGIRRILVPPHPGVLSALGLLMADALHDASLAILQRADALIDNPALLQEPAQRLFEQVCTRLEQEGAEAPVLEASLDMRYTGQSYELEVPLTVPITKQHLQQTLADFHKAHAHRYGYARPDEPVDVVTLRVRGRIPGVQPELPYEEKTDAPPDQARLEERPVWFRDEGPTLTTCYDRDRLRHGHQVAGPAVIHQYDTTIVVAGEWTAHVDGQRSLWLERIPEPT